MTTEKFELMLEEVGINPDSNGMYKVDLNELKNIYVTGVEECAFRGKEDALFNEKDPDD